MNYDAWKTTPPDDSGEVAPECECCGENVQAVNADAICAACEEEQAAEKLGADERARERLLEDPAEAYFDAQADYYDRMRDDD